MLATLAFGVVAGPVQAGDFSVEVNPSRALHLASPAETVLVGNPSIADISVVNPRLVYVLGRAYGKTNIIALDASGKQISQLGVDVVAPSSSTVTLTRGAGQLTYNCTPRCERTVTQGDSTDEFQNVVKQIGTAAALAQGAATSAGVGANDQASVGAPQ
jgi:Flp pilus assembly secretin CpaC